MDNQTKRGSARVEQAKAFVRDRIVAAAAANNTTLSGAELAMLTYSEADATPEQHDIAQEVDARIGEDTYERKIEGLIRSAYTSDLSLGMKDEWKAHLGALRDEDLYVLVMAERAGVFKSRRPFWSAWSLDRICFVALAGAGFAFFFLRIGIEAVRSEIVRVVVFVLWIAALWIVGEWSRRRVGRP